MPRSWSWLAWSWCPRECSGDASRMLLAALLGRWPLGSLPGRPATGPVTDPRRFRPFALKDLHPHGGFPNRRLSRGRGVGRACCRGLRMPPRPMLTGTCAGRAREPGGPATSERGPRCREREALRSRRRSRRPRLTCSARTGLLSRAAITARLARDRSEPMPRMPAEPQPEWRSRPAMRPSASTSRPLPGR